jgi:cysteine synthase
MEAYGIGRTPLFELPSINGNRVFLKLETQNFLGSVKARTGYALVNGLKVPKECIIVESTSGNLGLALDYFCKEDERSFLCLLDESVVPARLNHLKFHGVQYEIVPTKHGFDRRASRMERAEELTNTSTHYWVNQYDNEDGVVIHQKTTGPEIYEQTSGTVTSIFCAVGSGGTISGIGKYFKDSGHTVKIIGVEPYGSTIFHTDNALYIAAGAGFCGKPGNIVRHSRVVDDSVAIPDEESIKKSRELNMIRGLSVGLTTGMAYTAAEQFCKKASGETIVVIAADGMEFYNDYL